ncbi:hypothetical protein GQ457_06G004930 [Hibiscus cannabinus]
MDYNDCDNVNMLSPWSINNKLLILKEWPKEATLEEIDFSLAEFWVQIHNVPMALLNGNNAEKIGKLFPKFIKSNIDAEQSVRWDGQLRIFVAFRIEDPLKTGFILNRSSFNPIEVSFKYERLPEFCFSCGRLGHAEKECWYDYNRYTRAGKYGPWLRATSTWIKHNHNKNDEGNSTRVEEASVMVKGKEPLDYPMVKSKAANIDSEILGETKNPGLPGIMEAYCGKGEMTDQITNAALEIHGHGSGTIWNNPDFMADSLKDMDLSVSRKRKSETSSFSARKKQSLLKEINDGIFEISPGNWGDDGFGPVACESFLKLAFFPESVSGSSLIINKIENSKRGLSFGMRRLSLIKKAARRKHVYEIARMTVENNLVIEKGIDPYGYNLNCIPSFTVADDPSRIDDPMALAFEDVDTSFIVDDSLGKLDSQVTAFTVFKSYLNLRLRLHPVFQPDLSFGQHESSLYTSPIATILCSDSKQSMYCQWLCGLLQRNEVVSVGSTFGSILVRGIKFLEDYWKELCSNIRTGQLSDWISDTGCRNALLTILGKPNPELADSIEDICNAKSWEGIIRKL